MKNIVIIGAGGFGREVAWLIEEINNASKQWNLLGFIDDSKEKDQLINGYSVLGNETWLKAHNDINVVCAIGDPLTKKNVIAKLNELKITFATLIHPAIKVHSTNTIGVGTIICKGTILTVNVTIGNHVIINLDTTVGHDAIIGEFSTILPSVNISGYVDIKDAVSIGTGTQIIQEISIGSNSIIGAGAVVNKNIPKNSVAVGIPAKVIKKRDSLL